MKSRNLKQKKNFIKKFFPILLLISTIIISIGYASVNSVVMFISGTATGKILTGIYISEVNIKSYGVDSSLSSIKNNSKTMLQSTTTLSETDATSTVTYTITIYNNSNDNQKFFGVQYDTEFYDNENIVFNLNGLNEGDIISANSSKTFEITFSYLNNTIVSNNVLNSYLNFSFKTLHNISYIGIDNADLYPSEIADGETLNITFDNNPVEVVVLETNDYSYNNGTLIVNNVTSDLTISCTLDTEIPEIGEISFTINNTEGQADIVWSRLDSGGTNITGYTILLYNSTDDTLVNTYNTDNDLTSYSLTNINEGSYYVKIYGTDLAGNNGSKYVNEATTSTTYCRKSEIVNLKWVFNVTNNLTNLTSSGANTAKLDSTYSATLSVSGFYTLPTSINVSMNNVPLTANTDYTYDSSTGEISIPNVNGDITITASASGVCLIEGTQITLADGSTKNIENIGYDDLLLVWSYEQGRMVYEYPIWIEKEHKTEGYQLTKFASGEELKTIGYHGIYNVDLNKFVSVDNREEFDIGTNVAIINEDKTGFTSTSVVSIEYIHEEVNYYHVVSTRYYNIIANKFLTTDGTVILSNLYGFNDNITWKNRDEVINNKNNLYDYSEFSDIMPYYLFTGLRASEGKYLSNLGYLSKDTFKYYLLQNQMNDNMRLLPNTNNEGIRQWMVKTSDGTEQLVNEGSYYQLGYPTLENEEFLYWYDMSTGEKHMPMDNIKIWHGTYFEAVYK